MERQTLQHGWTLTSTSGHVPALIAGRLIPAEVPGSVHTDLLAAGLIPDPYLDRVEEELVWMHRASWRYCLEVEADAVASDERVDLVLDGLDTVATVKVNDVVLGSTANMHRGYRFDARAVITGGANQLTVDFGSALEYAEDVERALGKRPHTNTHPYNMVRKMACSFGWDWGPDFQTAGLWKPARLERWRTARLREVRPLVTVDEDGTGRVEVHVDVERSGLGDDVDLIVAVDVAGHRASMIVPGGTTRGVVVATVPNVDLWWPAGYGDQPLYDLDVSLVSGQPGQSTALDAYVRRVGFRTILVDTTPDETGTPFTIVVNSRPIFVKGANWIPDDHFLTRITRDRIERRVDQAVGAHMNMLRVWGGGIFETEDFYDVCDERGILVWQDFLFACAAYPEEEPIRAEVEAEVRENVARLTPHASLALWNGGNENLWGYADWGWPEQLADRTWGLGYYTELLPAIVAELDPTRFYASGSPYTPGSETSGDVHPNDQNHGLRHEWDVWNQIDYTAYTENVPRFCSEFGFQGPPTWATLARWVHDEPLTPTSPAFLLHQKAADGNSKLKRGLEPHLPTPTTFEDWHWATQLNQARAVTFGIEHFRSWWPRTAGALVWQLNDCWPVTSWAAVDSDERLKPLWYALRHAYAPRLLTVQRRGDRLVLVAVNDDDADWQGRVHVERQTFAGETLSNVSLELDVPSRCVIELGLVESLITPQDLRSELLVAAVGEVRTVHTFAEDLELAYAPDALSADVFRIPHGYRVDVRASSFARDVAVLAERVARDAVVDEMLVPLLAGERISFVVRTTADIDPASLAGPLVLRSATGRATPAAGD